MRFAERALALQVPGYVQYGFDFFLGEIKITNKVASTKVGLPDN